MAALVSVLRNPLSVSVAVRRAPFLDSRVEMALVFLCEDACLYAYESSLCFL